MASSALPVVAVTFDAGGVLANGIPSAMLETLSHRYAHDAHLQEKIAKGHHNNKDLWKRFKTDPAYTEQHYWSDLLARVPEITEPIPELQALVRESIEVQCGVVDIARELKNMNVPGTEQKYTLGIMSNHSSEWFESIAEKGALYEVFTQRQAVLVSQAVKLAKPCKEVFELLAQRVRACAEERSEAAAIQDNAQIVFIDDKPANVAAVQEVGLRGILWNNKTDSVEQLRAQLRAMGVDVKESAK